MKFHNPYQFINIRPASATIKYKVESKQKFIESEFVRHDYWAETGLSGTISCKLTTKTPLVIGAKQSKGTNDKPGIVEPYKQPDESIALPANSLRGMIGSLAENISQSSLRVLAKRRDCAYSVRKKPKETVFKDMGVLIKKGHDYYLHPIKATSLKKVSSYNGTKKKPNPNPIEPIKSFLTYQHHNQEKETQFVYAKISNHLATKLTKEKHENKTKGILYIRGKHFFSKINEVFIPWDDNDLGNIENISVVELNKVTDQVAELQNILKFVHNSKEHTQQLPLGYDRNFESKNAKIVKEGDLVYYQRNNDDSPIKHLSYSQIWRRPVEGNMHEVIEKEYEKNALPWNQARTELTPAEAMFGVVETDFKEEDGARNLASRIRFTDATTSNLSLDDDPIILKILDSPKPPSPSMYFQNNTGDNQKAISKQQLDLSKHKPNGRKHYLPHAAEHKLHKDRADWVTGFEEDETKNNYPTDGNNKKNWQQYLKVTPIPKNETFSFSIHFENLSEEELGLLLTTLEPADEHRTFIHKLGLGKPLGLGEVTLKISTVQCASKADNYTVKGLSNPPNDTKLSNAKITAYKQLAIDKKYVYETTLNELRTLYNPDNIKQPVCYPFSTYHKQKQGEEGEGFKWFVANDKLNQEKLLPINANSDIPELDSFEKQVIFISGLKIIPYHQNWKPMNELINSCSARGKIKDQIYDYQIQDRGAWLFENKLVVEGIMQGKETITIELKNHPNGQTYSVTLTTKF